MTRVTADHSTKKHLLTGLITGWRVFFVGVGCSHRLQAGENGLERWGGRPEPWSGLWTYFEPHRTSLKATNPVSGLGRLLDSHGLGHFHQPCG